MTCCLECGREFDGSEFRGHLVSWFWPGCKLSLIKREGWMIQCRC